MPRLIRFIFTFLSTVIILGVICIALILGGAAYFNAPPKDKANRDEMQTAGLRIEKTPGEEALSFEGDTLILEVRKGESAESVGKRLENAGIIKNRFFWQLLFRLDGEFIKTGTYKIELPAAQTKIRSRLIAGEQLLVRVTIPEGVTLKKTGRLLEDSGICSAEEFLLAASSSEILEKYNIPGITMEGYLYPDTYLFPLAYPASMVVSVMADNFSRRLDIITGSRYSFEAAEINRRVIIASIVEREYRVSDEAALMAGVFFNRLRIGMALQSCATVEYIITEIQGKPHRNVLYNRDLEIRDPYNSYLRPGLPPGPISAPGETALKAAFYPEKTDYLYFRLVNPSFGRHYFSRTLDDHIRAGTLYVKE
jgi:UPF0755 protein